jgi:hypothetical protein
MIQHSLLKLYQNPAEITLDKKNHGAYFKNLDKRFSNLRTKKEYKSILTFKKKFFSTMKSGVWENIFKFVKNSKISLVCQVWACFNETIVKKGELEKVFENEFIQYKFRNIIEKSKKTPYNYEKIFFLQNIPQKIFTQLKNFFPKALQNINKTHDIGSFSHKKILMAISTIQQEKFDKSLIYFWEEISIKLDNSPRLVTIKEIRNWINNDDNQAEIQKITYLSFRHIKLPALPPEIRKFTGLKRLIIYNIPDLFISKEIGCLHQLKELVLPHNNLTYIPRNIHKLSELRILNLAYNKLPDVPKEFGFLHKLQKMDLSNNLFINIPKEVKELEKSGCVIINN